MSSSAARCGDRRDRVPPAFLVHQRRHRRAHLTRRHPVQVQPRNRRVETRTAANVRRYQRRAKRHRRPRAAAELRPPPRRSPSGSPGAEGDRCEPPAAARPAIVRPRTSTGTPRTPPPRQPRSAVARPCAAAPSTRPQPPLAPVQDPEVPPRLPGSLPRHHRRDRLLPNVLPLVQHRASPRRDRDAHPGRRASPSNPERARPARADPSSRLDPASRTLRSRHPETRPPSRSGLDQSTRDVHNRRHCSVNRYRRCLKVVDRFRKSWVVRPLVADGVDGGEGAELTSATVIASQFLSANS